MLEPSPGHHDPVVQPPLQAASLFARQQQLVFSGSVEASHGGYGLLIPLSGAVEGPPRRRRRFVRFVQNDLDEAAPPLPRRGMPPRDSPEFWFCPRGFGVGVGVGVRVSVRVRGWWEGDFGIFDEKDIFGVDSVAAERAGGVGVEPGVDALDVEGVLAFGQEAEDFSGFETG